MKIVSHTIRQTAIVRTNDPVDLDDIHDVVAFVGMVAIEVSGDCHAMMDIIKPTARRLEDGYYEVLWEWEV